MNVMELTMRAVVMVMYCHCNAETAQGTQEESNNHLGEKEGERRQPAGLL